MLTHSGENNSDFSILETLWLSLLFVPASLVLFKRDGSATQGFLVLVSSRAGALMWRLQGHVVGEHRFFLLKEDEGCRAWSHECVADLSDWRAAEANLCPPVRYQHICQDAALPCASSFRLVLERTSRTVSVLAPSAARAFPNMTVEHLRSLARTPNLNVDLRGVVLEEAIVRKLVAHVFPGMPDVEVDAIVALRKYKKNKELPTPLDDPQHMPTCRELLGDGPETEAIVKDIEKTNAVANSSSASGKPGGERAASVVKQPASTGGGASSTDGPAAGAAPGPPRHPLPAVVADAYEVDMVKSWAPAVPGLRVHRERKWHSRWRATYPARLGGSASWSFGEKYRSEHDAIVMMLTFLWAHHHAATGEECPWLLA